MEFIMVALAKVALLLTVLIPGYLAFRKKVSRKVLLVGVFFIAWLFLFSSYIAESLAPAMEQISVTALDEHNKVSGGNFFIISGYTVDNKKFAISPPNEGTWAWYDISGKGDYVAGWIPGTEIQPKEATKTIELSVPIGKKRTLEFRAYPWGGLAEIKTSGGTVTLDAYSPIENMDKSASIPDTSDALIIKNQWTRFIFTTIIFLVCGFVSLGMILFTTRKGFFKKLEKHRFLFTQLVRRDFTLKYKRTVLGIVWSILSPLLNLLIMWLVFNKLLGSNVSHFVIYLFAGQLIYSYFCDATNQGMTSLLENSGIFSKINLPKYMFLLSKNVSSLINFGLMLVIFFVFVIIDGLPVTLQFLMLIYPITCLVVFNIGVGLILSALFVFFRDMQYLWGIMTQLIMWLSAIFYSIESYPQIGQNLFLLNPIYLFIRYFRKIVIDGQVPTIWFHLLMAGYTIAVLLIGCWIYKKKNHEFLYYI